MPVTRDEIEAYIQHVYVERLEPRPTTGEIAAFVARCRRAGLLDVYVECFERYYAPKRNAAQKRAAAWLKSAYADEVRTHLLHHYTSDLKEVERMLAMSAVAVGASPTHSSTSVAEFARGMWSGPRDADLLTVLRFGDMLKRGGLDEEEGQST